MRRGLLLVAMGYGLPSDTRKVSSRAKCAIRTLAVGGVLAGVFFLCWAPSRAQLAEGDDSLAEAIARRAVDCVDSGLPRQRETAIETLIGFYRAEALVAGYSRTHAPAAEIELIRLGASAIPHLVELLGDSAQAPLTLPAGDRLVRVEAPWMPQSWGAYEGAMADVLAPLLNGPTLEVADIYEGGVTRGARSQELLGHIINRPLLAFEYVPSFTLQVNGYIPVAPQIMRDWISAPEGALWDSLNADLACAGLPLSYKLGAIVRLMAYFGGRGEGVAEAWVQHAWRGLDREARSKTVRLMACVGSEGVVRRLAEMCRQDGGVSWATWFFLALAERGEWEPRKRMLDWTLRCLRGAAQGHRTVDLQGYAAVYALLLASRDAGYLADVVCAVSGDDCVETDAAICVFLINEAAASSYLATWLEARLQDDRRAHWVHEYWRAQPWIRQEDTVGDLARKASCPQTRTEPIERQ